MAFKVPSNSNHYDRMDEDVVLSITDSPRPLVSNNCIFHYSWHSLSQLIPCTALADGMERMHSFSFFCTEQPWVGNICHLVGECQGYKGRTQV